ncbi:MULTISPECIES: Bax inhibitor-1/YccA family protein [Idiomarinaceae]|uniref:Modulator of FtsH protease n=4 Tax=Pseudidiomarina TaxID=2800384 RepID=A0A368V3Z7_9GAMM|nr:MULTISPECIES: Bax inhibitor-1/YccA family protein [Idiomarinaceae]MDT7524964.1 Bax inhibitor-1/YccA family protein [Pseudidiomarina sp. GXY010]MDX1525052.1 Bax inhibitor-1/YccA family protein [Pseudidiomarina maritima]MRJ40778.1 FtsH protease modulator YccA [Idiomarina sp. FeN1]NCU56582.1 FtsH protease modulator YccA [Idiomarina sp. FenA--70]NCU58962.1 FtsH protease modulator YccA [Idiomarina sp. FenBw--71]
MSNQAHLSTTHQSESVLQTNKVLRNTYMLLGMTLGFSALMAFVAIATNAAPMHFIITLVGFYGLLFAIHKTANSAMGLVLVFALTGFMGYTIGPLLGMISAIGPQGNEIIMTAMGGTALIFFALSAYVLTTKKDMSFLGGMMVAGFVALVVMMIANIFLNMPALSLALSALFILFSAGAILMQTSAIIHGGERNYVLATVTLFVSIYNIFLSLIQLLMAFAGGDE